MIKSIDNYQTIRQKKNNRMLNFYKIYEREVLPVIDKYENEREKYVAKFTAATILCITLSIGFIAFNSLIQVIILGIIVDAIIILFIYSSVNSKFQKKVKDDLLQRVISGLGDIYWIKEKELIDNRTLEKSDLFGYYNVRTNDDMFEGKYNDLSFKISETKMTQIAGSGKSRRVYPIFSGVIILIDSNKETRAKTIITTKGDHSTRNKNIGMTCTMACLALGTVMEFIVHDMVRFGFGIFFLILFGLLALCEKKEQGKKMNNMSLEDPEFNKKYDVSTQDQIEGRYLVTTSFMERFKNLHTAFGTKMAKCAFFDNKVMFALSTEKNLFELSEGIFCSLKNPKQTKVFYEEISAIYDIIDYFKLAEKTGL